MSLLEHYWGLGGGTGRTHDFPWELSREPGPGEAAESGG